MFGNGCRQSQTEVNIREDMWVCPVLIHGGENYQRHAGWFHFIVLESFFKVVSAFATMTSGLLHGASHGSENAAEDLVEVKSCLSSHKTNLEIKRQSIIKSGFAVTATNALAYDAWDD